MEKRGKSESNAIQMAIGIVKNWASGLGKVDENTRAAARKAWAEWVALKARSAAKGAVKALQHSEGRSSIVDELAVREAALERVVLLERRFGVDGLVLLLGGVGELRERASSPERGLQVAALGEMLRMDLQTLSGLDIRPLRCVQRARRESFAP